MEGRTMYIIRYEEMGLGDACEILRECDGYFDGDGKVLVVDDSVLEEM
jgi:hypothetical protein